MVSLGGVEMLLFLCLTLRRAASALFISVTSASQPLWLPATPYATSGGARPISWVLGRWGLVYCFIQQQLVDRVIRLLSLYGVRCAHDHLVLVSVIYNDIPGTYYIPGIQVATEEAMDL